MREQIDERNWSTFLREYGERNEGRPTRLGIFESNGGVADDYWIEDGMPLIALDLYPNKGISRVDILFEKYTHPIERPAKLVHVKNGADEGLDFVDSGGKITVLRFESWPPKSEE